MTTNVTIQRTDTNVSMRVRVQVRDDIISDPHDSNPAVPPQIVSTTILGSPGDTVDLVLHSTRSIYITELPA
jgi:hypothetical protein